MVNGEPSAPRVPRIFLDDPEALSGQGVTIRGPAVRRLSRVLRLRRGSGLEVVWGDTLYTVELVRVGREVVEGEIRQSRAVQRESGPGIVLCPAIVRPQRFDVLLEKATELGVARIRPVRAERSYAKSLGRERYARWQRLVTEAAEQCRREQRPQIDQPMGLGTLVEETITGSVVGLLASERERGRRVADVLGPAQAGGRRLEQVRILVGPEGGFTAGETGMIIDQGWAPVTLGPRPLRSETAVVVAMAVVQEALLARP